MIVTTTPMLASTAANTRRRPVVATSMPATNAATPTQMIPMAIVRVAAIRNSASPLQRARVLTTAAPGMGNRFAAVDSTLDAGRVSQATRPPNARALSAYSAPLTTMARAARTATTMNNAGWRRPSGSGGRFRTAITVAPRNNERREAATRCDPCAESARPRRLHPLDDRGQPGAQFLDHRLTRGRRRRSPGSSG